MEQIHLSCKNTQSHTCCVLHAVSSVKGTQRAYEGSTLHIFGTPQINVLQGGEKKLGTNIQGTKWWGKRLFMNSPAHVISLPNWSLILCGVSIRIQQGCGVKDHDSDQPVDAGVAHICTCIIALISYLLIQHSQTCSSQYPQQPGPSLYHRKGNFRVVKLRLSMWEQADKAPAQPLSCFSNCRNGLIFFHLFLEMNQMPQYGECRWLEREVKIAQKKN